MNDREATGTFDVNLNPVGGDAPMGRLTIAKTFRGELEGTSSGEMLVFGTNIESSAGYVAMEHVTGTLAGRKGSFALQHSGTMNRGVPTLSVSVVPDSGTGELEGLAGNMTIENAGGQHSYGFKYSFLS